MIREVLPYEPEHRTSHVSPGGRLRLRLLLSVTTPQQSRLSGSLLNGHTFRLMPPLTHRLRKP